MIYPILTRFLAILTVGANLGYWKRSTLCLHLARNAIAHGIESAPVRAALGKPKTATVTLTARRAASRLTVGVGDDGAGVDVAVLRERARPTELRSVRAWLVTVAHRLCLNRLRSRKRQGRAFDEVGHVPPNETAACAETALVAHERSRILAGAVERLPTGLAELYQLRASGMSYEELAGVLNLPMGTVKSRMHDLVERLREEITQ